jgi:hypothetical protein
MYTQQLERTQAQSIESIIWSFRSKFICGIKRSRNDSFIVGQVAASLIEQLSGFLYDDWLNERVQRFVLTYLECYKDVDLCTILRNSQDEQLIDKLGMVMVGVPGRLKPSGYVGPDRGKVIDALTRDLEDAVDMSTRQLRADKEKWPHALAWLRTHPVYEDYGITLYTDSEQEKLENYYTPILERHMVFMTSSKWDWSYNYGDGGHFIVVLIANVGGRKETSRVPLEIFIQLLGLKRPEQVLADDSTVEIWK